MIPDTSHIFEEFIKKYNIAVEELTEKQLAEALRQAIQCGDFIRNIRVTDNAQQIVYIPFARTEELQAQYDILLGLVNDMIKSRQALIDHVTPFSGLL